MRVSEPLRNHQHAKRDLGHPHPAFVPPATRATTARPSPARPTAAHDSLLARLRESSRQGVASRPRHCCAALASRRAGRCHHHRCSGRDAGVRHVGRGTAPLPRSGSTAPQREQVRARSLSPDPQLAKGAHVGALGRPAPSAAPPLPRLRESSRCLPAARTAATGKHTSLSLPRPAVTERGRPRCCCRDEWPWRVRRPSAPGVHR